MEHEVLCELGKQSGAVIACGGGVVTKDANYAPLHQNGVLVYLKRDLSLLSTNGRPLSQRHSPEVLFAARKAKYEAFSDIAVQSTEIPEQTAEEIRKQFLLYLEKEMEITHENFSH